MNRVCHRAALVAWGVSAACTPDVDADDLTAIPGTSVAFDPDADVSTPETFFDHPWPSDSRLVELEKGQPIAVKMTGQGCALVVGYMKP